MLEKKILETSTGLRLHDETFADVMHELWNIDPAKRIWALELHAPHLMTIEEQEVWQVIENAEYFWIDRWGDKPTPIFERIHEHWATIYEVAEGERSPKDLPQYESHDRNLGEPPYR